jgi:hypothetical protein
MTSGTQNLVHSTYLDLGARGGLFIGEINDPITLSELPLTNHYIRRLHILKDITDYHCL